MEDIEYNNTKVLLLGGEDKYTLGNFLFNKNIFTIFNGIDYRIIYTKEYSSDEITLIDIPRLYNDYQAYNNLLNALENQQDIKGKLLIKNPQEKNIDKFVDLIKIICNTFKYDIFKNIFRHMNIF